MAFQFRTATNLCAVAAAALTLAGIADAQLFRGKDKAAARQSGQVFSEEKMNHDGLQRRYLVHDFSRGQKAPVVIIFHGGGGDAENAVKMTQFDAIAARDRFIAVYPDGTSEKGGPFHTWNATHCCASAMEQKVDDVGFVSRVIDNLVASGKADPRRIYVTGMSNGAMMSHRLGRELSNKIAAIAPVVGAVFGDEPPPGAPMPAFIIVGADDTTVPGEGGPLQLRGIAGRRSAADMDVAPAIAAPRYWARANGCRDPKLSQTPASRVTEWTNCASGADVVFHVVNNNAHAWPGGKPGRPSAPEPSQAFNASEEMWAFFKRHTRG